MFGKKVSSPQIDNAVSKSVNFEITLADMSPVSYTHLTLPTKRIV